MKVLIEIKYDTHNANTRCELQVGSSIDDQVVRLMISDSDREITVSKAELKRALESL